MKKASKITKVFRRAIKRGFDVYKILEVPKGYELEKVSFSKKNLHLVFLEFWWKGDKHTQALRSFRMYPLIFDTALGFIDKLVGEGRLMCGEENRPCDGKCYTVKVGKTPKNKCSMRKTGLAEYHRSKMANMSLIDIKKYTKKLL